MSEGLADAMNKEPARRNLSLREAEEGTGVSQATLSRLLSETTRPGHETCTRLAGALPVRALDVPEVAGHTETGPLTGVGSLLLEAFVGGWKRLREEDKRFVSRVMQTLLDGSSASA